MEEKFNLKLVSDHFEKSLLHTKDVKLDSYLAGFRELSRLGFYFLVLLILCSHCSDR